MKKQVYMLIIAIMLITVAGLSTAKAQAAGCPPMVANIPFAFSVREKTLPAGEYTVRCVNPDSSMKVLLISSKTGSRTVLVQTSSVTGKIEDSGRLVFHRYGDQYFFAQAWLPADAVGMEAPQSRGAKARELANEKRTSKTVLASTRR
jgi:hypothetical protein